MGMLEVICNKKSDNTKIQKIIIMERRLENTVGANKHKAVSGVTSGMWSMSLEKIPTNKNKKMVKLFLVTDRLLFSSFQNQSNHEHQ